MHESQNSIYVTMYVCKYVLSGLNLKRTMCIACRPQVDVHKGEGGPAHVDACGQGRGGLKKSDIFVDIINGWPLKQIKHYNTFRSTDYF